MKKINVITVDGPSASGKGELSRKIAFDYRFKILDSGLLYRLFAYLHKKNSDYEEIAVKIKNEIIFQSKREAIYVFDQNNDITNKLRTEEIAKEASKLSSKDNVRKSLFDIQRNFYNEKGLVADGRDMGTVVFDDAKLKIFLKASSKVRAKRRYLELQNLGQEVNMPALIDDIEKRDLKDSTRKLSPLIPADDAHVIDSSNMSLEEVYIYTKNLIKKEFI
jgi:cytidylate kinase